jgi:hypothetical protein
MRQRGRFTAIRRLLSGVRAGGVSFARGQHLADA